MGVVMDADERARLRALCATIPAGDVTPCCERAGEGRHHSSWSLGLIAYGDAIRAWVAGPLDLLALARTAIPALLDALDAAERERDAARAEVERLRAAITRLRDNAAEMQSCARAVGHVEEREACAELAEKWLREVSAITQDTPADLADAIRARGTGGAT